MSESELIPALVQGKRSGFWELIHLKPGSAPQDRGVRLARLPDDKPIHFVRIIFNSQKEMRLAGYRERSGTIEVDPRFFRVHSLTIQPIIQAISL